MKLLTFVVEGRERLGVATDRGVLDVAAAGAGLSKAVPAGVMDVLAAPEDALQALRSLLREAEEPSWFLAEETLVFAPCVPRPNKILCVGLNYRDHARETGKPIPDVPILFSKFNNALNGHGGRVRMPASAGKVDYEAELVIVIGRKAAGVDEADALRHVFGYCAGNDVSARDWQYRTPQWLLGKTPDGFAPIGPYVVTANEVGDPGNLTVECTVNGERRQHAGTSDMIFSPAFLISYISRHMTLEPGDLIFTGTPAGVAAGLPPGQQIYLQDGDVVEVSIEKLGVLRNVFVR